jgi:protein disulfide-isomerase A6
LAFVSFFPPFPSRKIARRRGIVIDAMKQFLTLVLLATALLAVLASASAEDPGVEMPGIVQLTKSNFKQLVGKKQAALVEFYAPWCGHCKHMAPEYAALGKAFQNSKNAKDLIMIGKVDATEENDLGKEYGITGFPTILYFPAGSTKPEKYESGRTAEDFVKFLSEKVSGLQLHLPQEVNYATELTAANFDTVAKDPTKSVLVMFYAPWCGHCKALKPKYSQVAKIYENDADIVIARIDADNAKNKPIAAQYNVRGFPTIYFFPKGEDAKPVEYNSGREIEDFLNFVNQQAGTHRLVNGDLSWDYGVVEELSKAAAAIAWEETAEAKAAAVEKVKALTSKVAQADAAAYYVKAAERIAEKGGEYVSTELDRLKRTLDGAVTGLRRDNMLLRMNILTAISKQL